MLSGDNPFYHENPEQVGGIAQKCLGTSFLLSWVAS
jgi:hypothetical protein